MSIPDELAVRFGSESELARRAVQALVLELYRAGRITLPELRHMLGYGAGDELDGFLEKRDLIDGLIVEDRIGHSGADDRLEALFHLFGIGPTLEGLRLGLVRVGA